MKKIILMGMVVFATNAITAQTNTATGNQTTGNQTTGNQSNEIKVPSQVMDKFNSDYPNTDVKWGRDGENYTASYKDQSTQGGRMVTYDKNGKVLYNDSEMNGSGYPSGIDDYYAKKSPNEKYTVWSSDDGQGDVSYYSKKNGKTTWFDKDGKYSSSRPGNEMQNTKNNKGNYDKDKSNNNTGKGTK